MKAGSKMKQLVKSKIEKSAAERAIEGILEGMSGSDLQVFSLSGYGIPDGLIGNLIEVCECKSEGKKWFVTSRVLSSHNIREHYGQSLLGRDSVETVTEAYIGKPYKNAIGLSAVSRFGDSPLLSTTIYTGTANDGHIFLNDNTGEETQIAVSVDCNSKSRGSTNISALAAVYNQDGSLVLVSTGADGYKAECLCKECSSSEAEFVVSTLWGEIRGSRSEVWWIMHLIASIMAGRGPNEFEQKYMSVVVREENMILKSERDRMREAAELFERFKCKQPIKNTIADFRLATSLLKEHRIEFENKMRMYTEIEDLDNKCTSEPGLPMIFPGEEANCRLRILEIFKKIIESIGKLKGPIGSKFHGSEVVATMFLAHMQANSMKKEGEEVVVRGVEREMSKRKVNLLAGNGFYRIYRYGSEGLICAVDLLESSDFEVYLPQIFRKLIVSNPMMLQLSVLSALISQTGCDDTDAAQFLSQSIWSAFRAGDWAISKYGYKVTFSSEICYNELVCPEAERSILHRDLIEMLVERGFTPAPNVRGKECFVEAAISIARPMIHMGRKLSMDRGISLEGCAGVFIESNLYILGNNFAAVRAEIIVEGHGHEGSKLGYPISSNARIVHIEKNDQKEVQYQVSLADRGILHEGEGVEI